MIWFELQLDQSISNKINHDGRFTIAQNTDDYDCKSVRTILKSSLIFNRRNHLFNNTIEKSD